MQQSHDLVHYGGSLVDAVSFGERALGIATRLDDEALAYGARFSLGQAAWLGGDFRSAVRFTTANMPENLRDPARVRDFGTAGTLMMDSIAILGACYAYLGDFDRAFAALDRAGTMVTDSAFDVSVLQYHVNRAHMQRGDAAIALALARESVAHATAAGLQFTLPWHRGVLGYALLLDGKIEEAVPVLVSALEESAAQHLPTANVRARVFLAEALVHVEPARALQVAEAGLGVAKPSAYRSQEAELLRVKSAALAAKDPAAAEAFANEGLVLARQLHMRPEEGHGHRVLGDICAASGKKAAAHENHDLARAIYRELGMTSWLDRMR